VFAHATEDEGRVERALMKLIPDAVERSLEVRTLSGHYGDPLTLLTVKVPRGKEAEAAIRNLVEGFSTLDRRSLIEGVDDRVDEAGNLYIRLDKQRAYTGKASLNEADPIRFKFRFRVAHGSDAVGSVRAFLAEVLDEVEFGADREPRGT